MNTITLPEMIKTDRRAPAYFTHKLWHGRKNAKVYEYPKIEVKPKYILRKLNGEVIVYA